MRSVMLRAAKNDTDPKRKRGPQPIPSLALRVSMNRLSAAKDQKIPRHENLSNRTIPW